MYASGQIEIDCDLCLQIYGLAVQLVGLISPLTHGINGGGRQEGVPFKNLDVVHSSIGPYARFQLNWSGDSLL
jgi:hypothetical protein